MIVSSGVLSTRAAGREVDVLAFFPRRLHFRRWAGRGWTLPAGSLFFLSFLLIFLPGSQSQAMASEESAWHEAAHSRIRLISATGLPRGDDTVAAAGIEVTLDDGWKTYWRTPGDGWPPSITFAGSENLAGAEVLWPAPKRLNDTGGLLAFGYSDRVVLPVLIEPETKGRPVVLRVKISYGVCAEICIPVETELEHTIPAGEHEVHRGLLQAAMETVPKRQLRGVYCPHYFITAKRRFVNGKPAILVKTAFQAKASGLDLFAEAPDGVDLPPPVRQPRASRGRLYHIIAFEDEETVNALKGQMLRLTMAADQGSCEIQWRVK
jgi:DsbC/DsbD-like thiol-disulfide interchange protein